MTTERIIWSIALLLTSGLTMSCHVQFQYPLLVKKLKEGNMEFAFNIFQNFVVGRNENVLISSLGVTGVMGMIALGTRGQSAIELKELFKFLKSDGEIAINQATADVLNSLCVSSQLQSNQMSSQTTTATTTTRSPEQTENFTFYSISGIYVQNNSSITIRNTYISATSHYYNATVSKLDLIRDLNKTEQLINDLISNATEKKLKTLISLTNIPSAQLLFANAVFFKARWAEKFEKRFTRMWRFHVSPENYVLVPMMGKQSEMAYTNRLQLRCRMLMLQYLEQRLVMYVVLPYEVADLQRVESLMTVSNFRSMVDSLRPTNVVLRLPRFNLQAQSRLSDTLKTMGQTVIFNRELADLRGMFLRGNPLAVTEIFHAAGVDVDEEGAPSTSNASPQQHASHPVEFTVDHPFIFLIEDQISGVILFVGRMVNPHNIF